VAEGTRSLLLEAATFHPATVRRTSQRLALRTDSSARFEKSLDPTLPLKAAAHFVRTLQDLAPELTLPAPVTDVGEWKDPARTIQLRTDRVRSLLGADIGDAQITTILSSLSFGVKSAAGTLEVAVPSARATKDITIEQDLVEEVGRIHRYGNIPEQTLVAPIQPPPRDVRWKRRMLVRAVQDRLSGAARFHETMSYSFVGDELLKQIGDTEAHVAVVNPVAEGFSRMRRSVMPSVLAAAAANRRNRSEVRLYEIGKGYWPAPGSEHGEPREVHECALVWTAPPPAKDARFDANALSHLRAVVDDLVRSLHVDAVVWSADAAPATWAHPRMALAGRVGLKGPQVVQLAALDPKVRRALGLTGELESDVACALVSIDALLECPPRIGGYTPIPKFPSVKVDVAIAAPSDTTSGALVTAIEKSGKGLVQQVELFDLYTGDKLGAGKKSLAYHVHLASDQKTLSEAEVQKFLERLERELTQLGAELRKV
jgi:phenylalanyl-tRNA synthetase beta chain